MGGICYTNEDFENVLRALANRIVPSKAIITSVVPFEKAVQGGFLELI
jgi:(R,R)-butanediol dehydrogenase/meso-butanediol dehydrogenase/diacetyl reductase